MVDKRSIFEISYRAFHNTLSVVSKEAEDAGAAAFFAGLLLNTLQILAFPFSTMANINEASNENSLGP